MREVYKRTAKQDKRQKQVEEKVMEVENCSNRATWRVTVAYYGGRQTKVDKRKQCVLKKWRFGVCVFSDCFNVQLFLLVYVFLFLFLHFKKALWCFQT